MRRAASCRYPCDLRATKGDVGRWNSTTHVRDDGDVISGDHWRLNRDLIWSMNCISSLHEDTPLVPQARSHRCWGKILTFGASHTVLSLKVCGGRSFPHRTTHDITFTSLWVLCQCIWWSLMSLMGIFKCRGISSISNEPHTSQSEHSIESQRG